MENELSTVQMAIQALGAAGPNWIAHASATQMATTLYLNQEGLCRSCFSCRLPSHKGYTPQDLLQFVLIVSALQI